LDKEFEDFTVFIGKGCTVSGCLSLRRMTRLLSIREKLS